MMQADFDKPELSLAEVLSSLSYALDLTGGNPMGHAQRTCLVAMRLGAMYGLTTSDLTSLYYAVLMKDAGCSSNAARMYEIFGNDDLKIKGQIKVIDPTNLIEAARFVMGNVVPGGSLLAKAMKTLEIGRHLEQFHEVTQTRCSRGYQIALTLGLSENAGRCIYSLLERWDGRGHPDGLKGEEIPVLARIANVAQHVEVLGRTYGLDAAFDIMRRRSGKTFDPEMVNLLLHSRSDHVLWEAVLGDPRAELLQLDIHATIERATEERIDAICDTFAEIVDAKSPFTGEHSSRVRDYSVSIAEGLGIDGERLTMIRRAALLHDIGKLAVPNTILDKPARLTGDEWQCVRMHPYYTEQILMKISGFERITEVASAHHERLDGSGYFKGLTAKQLDTDMRIIAVADVYDALSAKRPYRDAMPLREVFAILDQDAGVALDARCIDVLKSSRMTLGNLQQNAFTTASALAA
jgi:HD-GYP domain-containing protein (c-di-GMP phosphodiesterase class II)